MTIPAVAIPALVLASEFPTGADRTAGTFNTKSVAWANSENAMATRTREIAEAARLNALTANTAATEANADAVIALAQAGIAITQAGNAAGSANTASTQAASVLQMDKRYLGSKASAPTLDNQGAALAAGAVYYDTVLAAVRTWSGSAWVIGISAVSGVSSVNGATGAVVLALLRNVTYDNRGSLRALSPAAGDAAVVAGLGLFVWQSASTEPDDDESAFATASGVWLLEAVSWDVTAAWNSPDEQAQNDDDEDEPLRFASSFASSFGARVLTGSATCAITSVAATFTASFTGTVIGAAFGDRVIVALPDELGTEPANTGRLGIQAWVSAANTVTIVLTNASASSASVNAAIRTNWPITVIKS